MMLCLRSVSYHPLRSEMPRTMCGVWVTVAGAMAALICMAWELRAGIQQGKQDDVSSNPALLKAPY